MKKLSNASRNRLTSWLFNEGPAVVVLSVLNVLLAGGVVGFSLLSRSVVDSAVASGVAALIQSAVRLAITGLFILAVRMLMNAVAETAKARMKNAIRRQMLASILQKEYAASSKYHSGELVNRMFSDVNVVSGGCIDLLPGVLGLVCQLCGAAIVLWKFDAQFTVVLLLLGIVMMLGGLVVKKRTKALHKNVQTKEDSVHAVYNETMNNLRFIKASGAEQTITAFAGERNDAYFDAQMKRRNFSLVLSTGFGFITEFCWLLTIVWGCFGISKGAITFGTLTAMMQLVGQVQSPLASIPSLLQRFYGISASTERIDELLSLPEERAAEKGEGVGQALGAFTSICLRDVNFSYEDIPVLSGLSGEIKNGDFVAITGLSGVGKSTLFLLLLGIYTPSAGELAVKNGETAVPASFATRELFSYVPQGNAVFSGTIRENLTFLCPDAEEQTLWRAAKIACIDEFVASLPEGLDTRVGERGLGLSEGQAQRLAVARAVVAESPILLLDEATSALDEETEAALLSNLAELKDKTCLIVTHRKAALSICNKQLSLENGSGQITTLH